MSEHHAATLEMLGASARRSPEREARCGVTFPAAVAEWYALEDGERLFHDNSNQDRLVDLGELGDPEETRQELWLSAKGRVPDEGDLQALCGQGR